MTTDVTKKKTIPASDSADIHTPSAAKSATSRGSAKRGPRDRRVRFGGIRRKAFRVAGTI
jgi:hypothetical protein